MMTSETDNSAFSKQNDINQDDIDGILATVDANLSSNDEHATEEALETFKLVLHKYEIIPGNILNWTKEKPDMNVRSLITDKLQDHIRRIVDCSSLKLITIIPVDDTEINCEFVVQLLLEAIDPFSDEILKKLLCNFVIPEMFATEHKDYKAHGVLINFGFQLIERFPITKLSMQEVKLFTTQLIEQYIKVLEKWREQNFNHWHELWMFLVRFSAKHLHIAMDLANKLLRVVEFAFRNPSYEQRLKGYECWKELIDNASLDMKHMCSGKQIRLLVTPLRAKFSKMEVVICKRFEVFLYLLEKLQSNSVLCLNEFLEFCFGVSNTNSSSKNGQGKLVPNLWLRSIQVFLAILGDQTHISAELNRTIFGKPIINANNINRFDQVVVYSVIESSTILKIISITDAEKLSILKSLWKALFNILTKSSKEVQEKCFLTIFSSLDALFKDYNEDVTYLSLLNAFTELLDSTIDHRLFSDPFKLLIEHTMKFFNEEAISEELLDQFEAPFLKMCEEKHNFEFLTEQLKKLHPSKNEVVTYEFWKILGLEMINDQTDQSKSAVIILLWPVLHLQKCAILSDDICSKWTDFFSKIISSNRKVVINEIDKTFKSNPLLSSNISSIISPLGNDNLNLEEDIIEPLFKLMASLMSLPLLSQESAEKLFLLILKCTNLFIASKDTNLETVENICQCLQKIPAHRKDSTLLETVENLVKKMVPHANASLGKKLKNLTTMFSNTSLQKKALKISTLLSPDPSISPGVSVKRSIRMTQMVFDKNGSTPNKDKVDALQLFGKDVETLTPLKVKGSILHSTPSSGSSRSKRIINSVKRPHVPDPPIMDDPTSDFVVINTEVKLQKDMLTDHQKEKMRQRREDIPALYQDLSQSQTQSSQSADVRTISAPQVVEKNEDNEPATNFPDLESSCSNFMDQKLEITVEEKVANKTMEQLKKQEEIDSNTDSNDDSVYKKSRKFLPKSERELMRIQMDIVGGNSFIQNLPSKRPRKVNEKALPITPKKPKKTDLDAQINEKNPDLSTIGTNENCSTDSEQTEPKISSNDVLPETDHVINKPEDFPVVIAENVPSSSSLSNSDVTTLESTPNRRKNKLMKPIKNFDSPSSEKRRNKIENKETPGSKKNKKDAKAEKTNKKQKSPTGDQQSETLFESEISKNVEEKCQSSTRQLKEKPKKNNKITSDQESELSSEDNVVKIKKKDQITKTPVDKPKKSPKELMKKNKEKVKTIQSQLKLANLSDLEGSSEKNKPKNAKLIFIRELTNSKNAQDTKVSPAGLKRNKDNKSKSIAYAIETPTPSVKISSLNLIDDVQPSSSKSPSLEGNTGTEKAKRTRKRKRLSSVNMNIVHDESSSDLERKSKIRKSDLNLTEEDVRDIVGIIPTSPKMKSLEKETTVEKTNREDNPESPEFLLESPSRSTRSRTNSPIKRINHSPQNQETPKGVRSLFKESEDIIESSQGSFIENSSMSIGSISKSKIKQSPKLPSSSVKTQDTEKEETPTEIEALSEPSPETSSTEKSEDVKTEKPISQADTLTCESNYEVQPLVVQVEIQEKHELSDSEKLLSIADTVSIDSCITEEMAKTENNPEKDLSGEHSDGQTSDTSDAVMTEKNDAEASSSISNEMKIETFGTPVKNTDNLPSSPVSQATPTFNKELLDNTVDISPICLQSTDTEEDSMGKEILEALDAAMGESATKTEVEPVSSNTKPPEENKIMLSSNDRSNKLLNLVNVESPVSSLQKASTRKTANPIHMKKRYEKLVSIFRENGDEAKDNGSSTCTETVKNMLTFSREVPSPLAVPSSSILKRKFADTDDGISPCPKRKRVNFSYPCITSTKLFIRHRDELNTHYKPTFAANLFDDEPLEGNSEEEDPFADPESFKQGSSEEGMAITNSLSLCSKKPVDERLVGCEDTLDSLWKRLANPAYTYRLKKLLKSKNIVTIGDLASLNEVEINRLPFKEPKMKTVRKALMHYFNNSFNKLKDKEEQSSSTEDSSCLEEEKEKVDLVMQDRVPTEENIQENVENKEIRQPLSLKEEFRSTLKKMKEKNTSLEEFGEVLTDLVDESEIINLLESVYNTNFRKFFGKPHWRYLVESIVKSGGTQELFDIISDLAENNKVFSNQLEHIVQVRIDQDPLGNILKKKTLVQVGTALQDCIKDGEFQRENVLQTCLMPLIKSPSDIRNYFNSLTIVQIHDLFIERVQPSDLTCFLNQIKEHYGNYTIAQCANKHDVLKICSKEELATSLIERESDLGAVKHLISHICEHDKLLELYNYLGNLLPLRSRIESHIDLLRNIPFDKDDVK